MRTAKAAVCAAPNTPFVIKQYSRASERTVLRAVIVP